MSEFVIVDNSIKVNSLNLAYYLIWMSCEQALWLQRGEEWERRSTKKYDKRSAQVELDWAATAIKRKPNIRLCALPKWVLLCRVAQLGV